jgi:sialate O-acetylesterase
MKVFSLSRSFLLLLLLQSFTYAELQVADIFSDHMVLQTGVNIPIWGEAAKNSKITVKFAGQTITTTAANDGQWRLNLNPVEASAIGEKLIIEGETIKEFQDVLVGEVWYASGQSNMEFKMNACAKHIQAIKDILGKSNIPAIRYRMVKSKENLKSQSQIGDGNTWQVCSPENTAKFSAVAFLFARRLEKKLKVPIGIIESAWGGHPIEPFIPESAFVGHSALEKERQLGRKKDMDGLRRMVGGVWARNESWLPGTIYNSRISPVAPYAIRGALWYQAESNCGKGEDPRFYSEKMKALIKGWRNAWGNEKLPVYFVQLPQYSEPGWVPMRDQQRQVLSQTKNTGMAVIIDLALDGIHPPNKLDVAERLALFPLKNEYGKKLVSSGPLYKKMTVAGDAIHVEFERQGSDLSVGIKKDLLPVKFPISNNVNGFEVVDANGTWHKVLAVIQGNIVICRAEGVQPVGVRYAWAPLMPAAAPWNLYNKAGLPASPFISHPELAPYEPLQIK